jgi:hypothetical protein
MTRIERGEFRIKRLATPTRRVLGGPQRDSGSSAVEGGISGAVTGAIVGGVKGALKGGALGAVGGAAVDAYNAGDPFRESDQHHEGGGRDGAYSDDMSGGRAAGDGATGGDMVVLSHAEVPERDLPAPRGSCRR